MTNLGQLSAWINSLQNGPTVTGDEKPSGAASPEMNVRQAPKSKEPSRAGTSTAGFPRHLRSVIHRAPAGFFLFFWLKRRRPAAPSSFDRFCLNISLDLETKYTRIVSIVTYVMNTFLFPIEKPDGLMMKLAYYFTRRQFGKVLTPLKVHSARLPSAFGLFYTKVGKLDKKLTLPLETVFLIREQVARINDCRFCMDIGRSLVIKASMNEAKFDALDEYRTNSLFGEAERAALDYVTELTSDKKGNPDAFARLSRYYSEREICEIVWLVASEHLYNLTNIGLNIHSDMLCDISRKKRGHPRHET
jgi:alkylhydroperoxidase family enzyme